MEEVKKKDPKKISHSHIPLPKLITSTFDKLFNLIKPKNKIDQKQFLNKVIEHFKNIVNRIKQEINTKHVQISMLFLNEKLIDFISKIKTHKQIKHQTTIKIIEKALSILIYSLILSNSSEIILILNTFFSLLFDLTYFNNETMLHIINKLFKTIEPNGVSILLNPIGIELVKLDIKDKNKYLSFILEHFYHSRILNRNIITLMTGLVDFPNETFLYVDSLCCDYSFDVTAYIFCDILLYYQFLHNKKNNIKKNEFVKLLNKLVNKMVNDILNMQNILYCEKIEFYIMLLMVYEKEVTTKKDKNEESIIYQMVKENTSKSEIFLQCFIDMINIDYVYEKFKNYLNEIIGSLSNRIKLILQLESQRLYNYQKLALWEEKYPWFCLYLPLLENMSNNPSESSTSSSSSIITANYFQNNKFENYLLHYAPLSNNVNNQHSKNYLILQCKNNNEYLDNYDAINKQYILNSVLQKIFFLLQLLNQDQLTKKKKKFIDKVLQNIIIIFNTLIKYTKNDAYEDIILSFVLSYIKYKKEFIFTEWEHILTLIRIFYTFNHKYTTKIKEIINQIEELKYANKYNGNIYQLQELITFINEPSCQLFYLIIYLEIPDKDNNKLMNNLKKLFSLVIVTDSESDSDEDDQKDSIPILNNVISQNHLKRIYTLLLKIFNDKQSKEEKGGNFNPNLNRTTPLSILKQTIITNISKLMELLMKNEKKKMFIYDLLTFVSNIVIESRDISFNNDILKAILIQAETSNSIYKIAIPFFINYLSKPPSKPSKLQTIFDVIENRLEYIMKFPNEMKTDFSSVFTDFLCNSKVLQNFQIEKTSIKIKNADFLNEDSFSFAYLNTGIIADYLIFSLGILSKPANEVSQIDFASKIKAGFMLLLSTNFLILRGMNLALYSELFQNLIDNIINTLQNETFSETDANILIKDELHCYLYCLVNIAFHIDIENSNMKCTYLLSDGVSNYSKIKFQIIKNFLNNLNILCSNIIHPNTKSDHNQSETTGQVPQNDKHKSRINIKLLMQIFSVLEIYLFSINCNDDNIDKITNDSLYKIINSIVDICAKLIYLVKKHASAFTLRFFVYKFLFMTKEILCLYDDIILKVVLIISHLSHETEIIKNFCNNSTISSFFDKQFIETLIYKPSSQQNSHEHHKKKQFQLTKTLYFEVTCDYLNNYFITNAKDKEKFYTYFEILFKELSSKNEGNSSLNRNDLLDMKYIRYKIFFENVKWCLGSNSMKDNMIKPNYKKFDKNQIYPNFYIDKETYGLILSYEKDNIELNKFNINIRTAVSNIQYSITQNISSDNQTDTSDNYVITTLSQINSDVSLEKINIDKEFISLLSSLDTISVYKNIHCKVFFRNYLSLHKEQGGIERESINEDFIFFINALGILELQSQQNKKTIITSYDINNQIQYEYMEKNHIISTSVDNRVTLIWCDNLENNCEKELISSINDGNEFYIIICPMSDSHFLVKIVNEECGNVNDFMDLFQGEIVMYVGENYELLVTYISKMVIILNLFSRIGDFVEKQKNANDDLLPNTYEYVLHNNDNLFQRFSQINTIGEKYMKK